MIDKFAHEAPSHIHSGDSSSPALYIGFITIFAVALAITAVMILSRKSAEKRISSDNEPLDN